MKKNLPGKLHFVGAGGIGMSALAQMARSLGHEVTGSDRALHAPENSAIFQALCAQGVKLCEQDGSVYQSFTPEAIIYSTAIEEDNPDFKNAPAGMERIHRSVALERSIQELSAELNFAVTGTCGKTSVSAWLAEALENLGQNPGVISGGLINAFRSENLAGNYRRGSGRYFVIEADESDKSLLNYPTDAALILNIGTDHYSKEELARVFGEFAANTSRIAVLEDQAYKTIRSLHKKDFLPEHQEKLLFSTDVHAPDRIDGIRVIRLNGFSSGKDGAYAAIDGHAKIRLPGPGFYTAANALAVYTALLALGFSPGDAIGSVESFHGVWRRFNAAGKNGKGALVFDDYAHNVEKIISCIEAGRELSSNRVIALFQPHGFKPFGFMREELFSALEKNLRPGDRFVLMPVFYAGGSSSFSPTAEEVAAEYQMKTRHAGRYLTFSGRKAAQDYLHEHSASGDVILVMGARDNSLSNWARTIARTT